MYDWAMGTANAMTMALALVLATGNPANQALDGMTLFFLVFLRHDYISGIASGHGGLEVTTSGHLDIWTSGQLGDLHYFVSGS